MIFSFCPIKNIFSHISRSFIAAALLVFMLPFSAFSATYYWVGGTSGDWSDSSNWNTAQDGTGTSGIPGSADSAFFTSTTDAVSVTNTSGSAISVGTLTVLNRYNDSDATLVSIDMNGAALVVGTMNVGQDAAPAQSGNLKISNATVTVGTLDSYAALSCKLTLENTSLDVTNTLWANSSAADTRFYISGDSSSSFTVSGNLHTGTTTYYTLQTDSFSDFQGKISLPSGDSIAEQLFGFTWTGGASSSDWTDTANWSGSAVPTTTSIVLIPGSLEYYPEVTSTTSPTDSVAGISITGGTLTISGGSLESGTVSMSAGTLSVDGGSLTSGTVSLSGGTLSVTAGTLSVSDDFSMSGTGALSLGGGSISVADAFGMSGTSSASVSDGTFAVSGSFSLNGTGEFVQNGGTVTVAENLNFSDSGKYRQTSGNLALSGDITASSSGGISATGGKVTFAGASSSVSGGHKFYEVDFSSDSAVSFSGAEQISILTVDHDVGVNLAAAASLETGTISGSGTLTMSGSGNLSAAGIGASASRFGNFVSTLSSEINCTGNVNSLDISGNVAFGSSVTDIDSSSTISTMTFGGTVSGTELTFTSAAGISLGGIVTTSGNQVYTLSGGTITVAAPQITSTGGDITFGAQVSCSSNCTVSALTGTISFEGLSSTGNFSATASSITLNPADYATSGVQTYTGNVTTSAGTSTGNFALSSGSSSPISVVGNLTLLHSGSTYTLSSNLSVSENFYFIRGGLNVNGGKITSGKTFAVWGSNYNATDPRYQSANTRFALAGADSVTVSSPSASFTGLSGAEFAVGGKFYVNGADLNATSLTVTLPANADSAVRFNGTETAASGAVAGNGNYTQWGGESVYAAVFNCTVSNVTVACATSGGYAYISAAKGSGNQNVTDGGGNTSVTVGTDGSPSSRTGFQFLFPEISEAYSVFDDVIYVKFTMPVENSHNEINRTLENIASLSSGGVWYGTSSYPFGSAYADADCSTSLPASGVMELYLKISDSSRTWNTDATASETGNEVSTDRKGNHQSVTTDLSMMVGVFSAKYGHTMGKNYGTGSESSFTSTYDKCHPVLTGVYIGQELHSENSGTADSQKYYDAHNFIEFRYSEPVNIGSLLYDGGDQNVRATSSLGEITNNASGFTVAGLATFASGNVDAFSRAGGSPHSLYRNFSLTVGTSDTNQISRLRLSVAGYVDGSISYDSSSFHKWIGYINHSSAPSGAITCIANDSITDLAVDADGNSLNNTLDTAMTGNHALSRTVNTSSSGLYGAWDSSNPVFAVYVSDLGTEDTGWDWTSVVSSSERQYEVIGAAATNTGTTIANVELHLFDNTPAYSLTDSYKWVTMNGWSSGGVLLSGFDIPENAGGARPFVTGAEKTSGGIRRSSLDDAISAFTYVYSLDSSESSPRSFTGPSISQNVKSGLFQKASATAVNTKNDGLYLNLALNSADSGSLPLRTTFVVTYDPSLSYITDLAGNRLIEVDSGSSVKKLHTVDVTPPSFSLSLAPIAQNKLYMVFTKPLGHGGVILNHLGESELASVMNLIKSNLEFVLSDSDDKDTTDVCSDLYVESVSLASPHSEKYTALLLTLNRNITLSDIETTWLRVSNSDGLESVTNIFGTENASPIQDKFRNSISLHACHAISDFALNAVNVLYAYANSTNDDGWNEKSIYGTKSATETDGYSVHDFYADAGKSGTLKTGNDIVFQVQFVGGTDSSGYFAPQNGETFVVIPDCKDNLNPSWISDKFNKHTGLSWRIWLPSKLDSLSTSYNTNSLSIISDISAVTGSALLKNFTMPNSVFHFGNKKEYQFLFALKSDSANTGGFVLDSNGYITINHDGDSTTDRIPLYALWMPSTNMGAGDYSFADLWSFVTRDIVQQRGGVTILNNVIDSNVKEQTVVEVVMPKEGTLNVYVMTLDGNIVKRLSKGRVSAGTHYYQWNGTNNKGKSVARGMYFVRVVGPEIDETRKVMVVKN